MSLVCRSLIVLVLAATGWGAPARPAVDAGRTGTESEIAQLTRALEATAADMSRWAYTENRVVRDEKGRVKTTTVVRYDPSKPYPEQWTPISVNGKPPDSGDRSKYRRQGERAARHTERGESAHRYSLGELLELGRSRVVREEPAALVFEVPLRVENNNRFPPEKFEVLVRVRRDSGALEQIAVRLRESFRAKLIVKVKSGEGVLEFAEVAAPHPPTLTAIRGDASISILFVSVGGELDLQRSDFKHVKPYGERFEVKIGTLKAIDF